MPGESQPKPATSDRPSPAKGVDARVDPDAPPPAAFGKVHRLFDVLVSDLTDTWRPPRLVLVR